MTAKQAHRAIIESRYKIIAANYAKLQRQLIESYSIVFSDTIEGLKIGRYTEGEVTLIKEQIERALKRFQVSIGPRVQQWTLTTTNEVGKMYKDAILKLNLTNDLDLKIDLRAFNADAYNAIFVRRAGGALSSNFKTITNWNNFGKQIIDAIDKTLSDAVASGEGWAKVQNELAHTLAMGNDNLRELVEKAKANPNFNIKKEGLSPELTKGFNKLLFDSRRIAITEINNAYHEAQRQGAIRSPVVKALKWQVSSRHNSASPDICDVLANENLHGLGKGIYFAETIPAKPHPFCMCTTIDIFRPMREWDQKKQVPNEPRYLTIDEGKAMFDKNTDSFVERQISTYNENQKIAWDIALKSRRP